MRNTGRLRRVFEIVTIISNIVIGVTMLTFLYQGVEASKSYIGSIILAIGATELVGFIALKDLVKLKNIPNAVVAVASMILGGLLLFLDIELPTVCIVCGICAIVFQIAKIVDAAFNIIRQPFLNIFVVILCIIEIIFAIFLIVRTTNSLNYHLTFIGISVLVQAVLLVVEFLIHISQKDSL